MPKLQDSPHRRWNPLLESWVLVSPHRADRPWHGAVEKPSESAPLQHDPNCYLCPGSKRSRGEQNPEYKDVFVFDNDFSAVLPATEGEGVEECNGLVRGISESGKCRVVCFSPRHDFTIPQMEGSAIRKIIDAWEQEFRSLSEDPEIGHVMIFENKGAMMGCSNSHPHGQIWATKSVPTIPARISETQNRYFNAHGTPMLIDYVNWELSKKERIVCENDSFVSLVPYWASWPFEAIILPRRHISQISESSDSEKDAWASILRELTIRYDNLFETSFPYSMGIYQSPSDCVEHPGFTFHQVFFPPLLRSSSVKKFMVGYELCAEPQRDISPEVSAGRLRALKPTRYSL